MVEAAVKWRERPGQGLCFSACSVDWQWELEQDTQHLWLHFPYLNNGDNNTQIALHCLGESLAAGNKHPLTGA